KSCRECFGYAGGLAGGSAEAGLGRYRRRCSAQGRADGKTGFQEEDRRQCRENGKAAQGGSKGRGCGQGWRQTGCKGCGRQESRRRQAQDCKDQEGRGMSGDIEDKPQPLIEHLIELRKRLLWAVGAFFIAFLVCF